MIIIKSIIHNLDDIYNSIYAVNRDKAYILQYLREFEYFMIENKKP